MPRFHDDWPVPNRAREVADNPFDPDSGTTFTGLPSGFQEAEFADEKFEGLGILAATDFYHAPGQGTLSLSLYR